MHSLYRTPLNLNGKMQVSPLTVAHPEFCVVVDAAVVGGGGGGGGVVPGDGGVVVVPGVVVVVVGGGIVVPGRFLGHSVVPVVVLTQSMTSRSTKFC